MATDKQVDYAVSLQKHLPESEQYDIDILRHMSNKEISGVITQLKVLNTPSEDELTTALNEMFGYEK